MTQRLNPAIDYRVNAPVTAEQFLEVLDRSGLAQRRPVDDRECIEGMVAHGNLMVSAWDGARLVGVARSLTDFHYACYLSDLAVDRAYQGRGVGKGLLRATQGALQRRCRVILVAAPDANGYYEYLGLTNNPRCWVLERDRSIPAGGHDAAG